MRALDAGRLAGILLLLLLVLLTTVANAPAPYWACAGQAEGDRCEPYGASSGCFHSADDGTCRQVSTCTDDLTTTVNECLYCQ